MRRQVFARYSLLVVAALLLHIGLIGDLSFSGVHPDIPLLLTVAAGIVGGPQRGVVVGFALGLLIDPLLATPLGMTALVLSLVGVGSGYAEETINTHSKLGISMLCLGCSAAGVVLFAVVGELFGRSTLSNADVGRIIGVVAMINGLLAMPVVTACMWAEDPETNPKAVW